MAIGWMTILQSVPWSDVIRNAPKVADGAKKLWRKVGGKGGEGEAVEMTPSIDADQAPAAQLAALRAQVEALHGQMLASSEVIQALAEQNAQLIVRIETHRRRLLWLVAGNAVALVVALAAWLR
jgi:nucleotide-binding universal stress UspA family protein